MTTPLPFYVPSKYKLLPEVVQFCLNGDFFTNLDDFFQRFDFLPPEEGTQHRLEYTEIHQKFVDDFEKGLEEFIVSRGSTVEKFYELCKTASEMKNETITTFIGLLFQCIDFSTFIDIARSPEKRKYFYQIMSSYGKMFAPVAKPTLGERFTSWFSRDKKGEKKADGKDKDKESKSAGAAGGASGSAGAASSGAGAAAGAGAGSAAAGAAKKEAPKGGAEQKKS